MLTPLFHLRDVFVHWGRLPALVGVDLTVQRGECLALIGGNGSGKSSLLRVVAGLRAPSRGQIERGLAVRQAMVFQRPYMLRASAGTNLALGLWLAGWSWRQARMATGPALQRVGLADVAAQSATSLSVGQQQRLALARAWAMQPDLLLLDEPTSSLDPAGQRAVEALMQAFAASGMTMVFASHNLAQVQRIATRVVYLEQGRLLADLPTADFFNRALLAQVSPQASVFVKGELG